MRTIFQGPMHQNESSIIFHLTHCGLVTPGSGSILAEIMACCLTAPIHYMNHVDLSSIGFCGKYLRAISQEVLANSFRNINWKIIFLKLLTHIPGANELISLTPKLLFVCFRSPIQLSLCNVM